MLRHFAVVLSLCASTVCAGSREEMVASINAASDEELFGHPHVDGELLVRFNPSGVTTIQCEITGQTQVQWLQFCTHPLSARFHPFGAGTEQSVAQEILESEGLTVIEFFTPTSFPTSMVEMQQIGLLAHVQVPSGMTLADARAALMAHPEIEYVAPNSTYELLAVPNDPEFAEQWYHQNAGQDYCELSGGTALEDVRATEAWDITTGSSATRVALFDQGILMDHEDLAGNVEVGIDDWPGFGGHGTNVAGVIGAVGNNGVGVAGICWDVSIVAYNAPIGSFNDSVVLGYFEDVVAEGIKVINASWGLKQWRSGPLYDGLVTLHEEGVLFVAAAGNFGQDSDLVPVYPAAFEFDNILSVAATNSVGELSHVSNYGIISVDIAAPGEEIMTTHYVDPYECTTGTSLATPLCTGTAALLLSQKPHLSSKALKNAMMYSSHALPALEQKVVSGGRLDARASLDWIELGDVNGDNLVDLLDIAAYQNCFGSSTLPCVDTFDLSGDDTIGLLDLKLLDSLITGPTIP